jgi:hypothetical protein
MCSMLLLDLISHVTKFDQSCEFVVLSCCNVSFLQELLRGSVVEDVQ